jgi:hypothetical protein
MLASLLLRSYLSVAGMISWITSVFSSNITIPNESVSSRWFTRACDDSITYYNLFSEDIEPDLSRTNTTYTFYSVLSIFGALIVIFICILTFDFLLCIASTLFSTLICKNSLVTAYLSIS